MTDSTRRRFLAGASTAAIVGLAGCSALPFGNDGNSSNNSEDEPDNLEDQFGNNNTTEEDVPEINYPEGGYIDNKSGEIKQSELDGAEPVEYIFAAREAYQLLGTALSRSFRNYDMMVTRLNNENPVFEEADKDRKKAAYWADWASFMSGQAITLLQETEEREALSLVQETKNVIDDEYIPFVEDRTAEFVDRYEQGDMGYVGENSTDLYETFQGIKDSVYWWSEVESQIDTEEYPGYGERPWEDVANSSSNSSN